jgi:hypothetical protein
MRSLRISPAATSRLLTALALLLFFPPFLQAQSTPATDVINVLDYGATGDGLTDDSAAVQAALDAANNTTASATVYFPTGKYLIATPITLSLEQGKQSQLRLVGAGSSSRLIFGVNATQTALAFTGNNVGSVTIKKLAFTGAQTLHRGISFSGVLLAIIEDSHFYGVNVTGATQWGGTVYFTYTRLIMRRSSFRACGGGYGADGGVVTGYLWRGLDADTLEFLDYGTLNGDFFTIANSPDAWIRLGNVNAPTTAWEAGGHAYIRNVVSDEGGANTLRAYTNDGSVIQNVDISQWRANNGSHTGFWFHNVNNVILRNSQMGYQPSVVADGFPAVLATNVQTLNIERSEFIFNSNNIVLREGVKNALIADSTYKYLENSGDASVSVMRGGVVVEGNIPGVSSFNSRTGEISLSETDVATALGYKPANSAGDIFSGPLSFNAGGSDRGRVSTLSNGLHLQAASSGWTRNDLFISDDGVIGIGTVNPLASARLEVNRGNSVLPGFTRAGGIFRISSVATDETNIGVVAAADNKSGGGVTSTGVFGFGYDGNSATAIGVRGRAETGLLYDSRIYGGYFEGAAAPSQSYDRQVFGLYSSALLPGNSTGNAYGVYSNVTMSSVRPNAGGAWGVYSTVDGAGSSVPLYGFFANVAGGSGPKFSFFGNTGTLYNAGRVGIGITTPATALDVNGAAQVFDRVSGHGTLDLGTSSNNKYAYINLGPGSGYGWQIGKDVNGGALGGPNGFYIYDLLNSATRFSISTSGNVGIGTRAPDSKLHVSGDMTVSGDTSAISVWTPAASNLTAGTVVVLDPERPGFMLASSKSYDTSVAGVVAPQAGIKLGTAGAGKALIASSGQVKVKVDATNNPIKIGDLLVTSDVAGVAMKSVPINFNGVLIHRPGTLIGKALEPLAGGTGEILALLSLQ